MRAFFFFFNCKSTGVCFRVLTSMGNFVLLFFWHSTRLESVGTALVAIQSLRGKMGNKKNFCFHFKQNSTLSNLKPAHPENPVSCLKVSGITSSFENKHKVKRASRAASGARLSRLLNQGVFSTPVGGHHLGAKTSVRLSRALCQRFLF